MTREEFDKRLSEIEIYEDGIGSGYSCNSIDDLTDEIFDEHEAQLKKLKNGNLEETELFNKIIKSKDERIKELECRAYHAERYINDLHNNINKEKKDHCKSCCHL